MLLSSGTIRIKITQECRKSVEYRDIFVSGVGKVRGEWSASYFSLSACVIISKPATIQKDILSNSALGICISARLRRQVESWVYPNPPGWVSADWSCHRRFANAGNQIGSNILKDEKKKLVITASSCTPETNPTKHVGENCCYFTVITPHRISKTPEPNIMLP